MPGNAHRLRRTSCSRPSKGKVTPLATPVRGKPPGELELGSAPGDKPTKKPGKEAVRFQLELGGEVFPIELRSLAEEAGRRFEIRFVARGKTKKGPVEFTSKTLLFARFGHFKREPRAPVIAYITGGDDDAFFKTSLFFWRQHADLVVERDGMSLEGIVRDLHARSAAILKETGGKGWGEVNIVCHGTPIAANIKIVDASSERNLRLTQLDKVLGTPDKSGTHPLAFKVGKLGLTESSRIVFRACSIGRRPDLLARVAQDVFGGVCEVRAPKFLQQYRVKDVTKPAGPTSETFLEEIAVHLKTAKKPSDERADAVVAAKFNRIYGRKPPGKQQSYGIERATFTIKKIRRETNALSFSAAHEALLHVDPKTRAGRTLEEFCKVELDKQRDTDNFDFSSTDRWKTGEPQFAKRKARAELEVRASSSNAFPPRAVGTSITVGSNDAIRQAIAAASAPVVNGMHSLSATLGDDTLTIDASGKAGFRVKASGAAVFSSGSLKDVQTMSGSVSGDSGVTLTAGSETLRIGRSFEVEGEFPLTRFLVSFRRVFRVNEPKTPYAKRAVIVPNVLEPTHFGSSNDPPPSPEKLRALAE